MQRPEVSQRGEKAGLNNQLLNAALHVIEELGVLVEAAHVGSPDCEAGEPESPAGEVENRLVKRQRRRTSARAACASA